MVIVVFFIIFFSCHDNNNDDDDDVVQFSKIKKKENLKPVSLNAGEKVE